MSEDTSQALLKAYELIEDDKHADARRILEPIIENDPDNANAWWLYAHAVEDADEAKNAMDNLNRIDPNYPGARSLYGDLEQRLNSETDAVDVFEIDFEKELNDDSFDDFELEPRPTRSGGGRRWLRILIPLVVLILVIVAAFLLLSNDDSDDDSTADNTTPVVTSPPVVILAPSEEVTEDVEPTNEPDIVSTSPPEETEIANVDGQSVETNDILAAFSQFDLSSESIDIVQSSELGETLVVSICVGDTERETLDAVMDVFSEEVDNIDTSEYDSAGVRMVDCNANVLVNLIAVSIHDLASFQAGELTEDEFRTRWNAIG